jgi:hypothetical protein
VSFDDPDVLDPELEQRLRRGLAALAEETPAERPAYRRHLPVAAAAATIVIAAGAVVAVNLDGSDDPGPVANPHPTVTSGSVAPPIGGVIEYDLQRLVSESERIVVGTVTDVEHHGPSEASGGLAYALATVEVEETVNGPAATQLVAFDYDYGDAPTTEPGLGASFVGGQRVLLFLASVAGTVHEQLDPPHWQVTGGAQGEYVMDGDEPSAPFTMADVRRAAAR